MNSGTNVQLLTADQIETAQLRSFLERMYGDSKARFLESHGGWWHRGQANRWLLTCGDEIAAYCGVIPVDCAINGVRETALWWVDLVVHPDYRALGLQTYLDREVRRREALKLGFPNSLAARIHKKHGWGVREDLKVMMLPLDPRKVRQVRDAKGYGGALMRAGAHLIYPLSRLAYRSLHGYVPKSAQILEAPAPEIFANIYARFSNGRFATTYRDTDFLRWRYFSAPYRSELKFYTAGPVASPTHYLIMRYMGRNGATAARILDLFGDFEDVEGLRSLLRLAVKDAYRQRAAQIAMLASMPEIAAVARSVGFLIQTKARFCWHDEARGSNHPLAEKIYWTLGDSDNDLPAANSGFGR